MSQTFAQILQSVPNTETRIALEMIFALVGVDLNTTIGEANLKADSIQFDTELDTPDLATGQLHWSAANGTLEVAMLGGEVVWQAGQENYIRAFNQTGSTIPNGAAVYVDDAGDQKPHISLASADSTNPIVPNAIVIGLATEDIEHGSVGYVTTQGLVRDIDTSGITEGVPLFLSVTPGGWQEAREVAPDYTIGIGYCIRAHNNLGIILVTPIIVPRLISLSDCLLAVPDTDGQYYQWNTTTSRFEQSDVLRVAEATTPSAEDSIGKVYPKADNKLYFQDGAGVEHEIAFV